MAGKTVTGRSPARTLTAILDSPEITGLIRELEVLRWTGRKGYPIRSLVGACLAKSLYAIPTWSRTAALIAEHTGLQEALGGCPSVYALYRFTGKLRRHKPLLDSCLERVTASLRNQIPEYGEDIAIDASDLSAYANGQRYLSKHGPERERFSDPDASWGHRSAISTRKGGGFYGYKLHAAMCARTDLPITWTVKTARTHESSVVSDLLMAIKTRGFTPETAALDRGYDVKPVYEACEQSSCQPIIPLRKTPAVKRGAQLAPRVRARHLDIRWSGLPAQANEMALPDRKMLAQERLAEGQSSAPAHPARDAQVALPLPCPRRSRTRVRQAETRLRPRTATRPRY